MKTSIEEICREAQALLDDPTICSQIGLAAALGTVVLLLSLPLGAPSQRVAWGPTGRGDVVQLQHVAEVQSSDASDQQSAVITTDPPAPEAETDPDDKADPVVRRSPSAEGEDPASKSRRSITGIRSVATLGPDGTLPKLLGGIQGLYLKIRYPREAIDRGIEGQTILRFVVLESGETAHVEVMRSLHPLCDSAAVRAVEDAKFAPAVINDTPTAVWMSLPVRFKLIRLAGPDTVADTVEVEET